ncbi:Coatomer subunit gamma (CopG) [Blattamonas nauphoetae]|uniref:Coatomer subunit gamma (CopG) n=2 Tax=Blattamonas nauphoetae TaxID=2049346 RepID=A0ABQ9YHN3_9EUKA|nr:Coatomer subunit gamma (CopG) [Blattamonas nauphoetae]
MDFDQKDTEDGIIPYNGVDKQKTIIDAKAFSQSGTKASRSRLILTRILNLLHTGETFQEKDAETIFFGATKLFHNPNRALHHILYMTIKSLRPNQTNSIIATSALTNDLKDKNFRTGALRVLTQVVDNTFLMQVDKHFHTALIDNSSDVASAGLLACLKISKTNPDFVRRWIPEISECVTRFPGSIPQYHALAAIHAIRRNDAMEMGKFLLGNTAKITNGHATCLMIRYAVDVLITRTSSSDSFASLQRGGSTETDSKLLEILDNGLDGKGANGRRREDDKAFEIQLEAIRNVLRLYISAPMYIGTKRNAMIKDAIKALVAESTPSARLGVIRALYNFALKSSPKMMQYLSTFITMPNLTKIISDSNHTLATYACCLLVMHPDVHSSPNDGKKDKIESIAKDIWNIMRNLSADENNMIIDVCTHVVSISPSHALFALHIFLASLSLHSNSDTTIIPLHTVKLKAVNEIINAMQVSPNLNTIFLGKLREYLEDCDEPEICATILRLFADSTCQWYDANKRTKQEQTPVAIVETSLKQQLGVGNGWKGQRLLMDAAARAGLPGESTAFLSRLSEYQDTEESPLISLFLNQMQRQTLSSSPATFSSHSFVSLVSPQKRADGQEDSNQTSFDPATAIRCIYNRACLDSPPIRLAAIDALSKIRQYCDELRDDVDDILIRIRNDEDVHLKEQIDRILAQDDVNVTRTHFETDLTATTVIMHSLLSPSSVIPSSTTPLQTPQSEKSKPAKTAPQTEKKDTRNPEHFGPLDLEQASTSQPVMLTGPSDEFIVSVSKVVTPKHIGFHYQIKNTVDNIQLRRVGVMIGGDRVFSQKLKETFRHEAPSIDPHGQGECVVVFERGDSGLEMWTGSIQNTLTFDSHEFDPKGVVYEEGEEETEVLYTCPVHLADYLSPTIWNVGIAQAWEKNSINAAKCKFKLTKAKNIPDALSIVTSQLKMEVQRADELAVTSSRFATNLSGVLMIHNAPVSVVPANVTLQRDASGITVELEIRAEKKECSNALIVPFK